MWKLTFKMTMGIIGLLCSTIASSYPMNHYIKQLQAAASKARTIYMYYDLGTDAFYDSDSVMKKDSMYVFQIKCFLNCGRYSDKIIYHFAHSKLMSSCPKRGGDKYLLIDFGSEDTIKYVKWGNIIEFRGKCFYNTSSIRSVLPDPVIFEKMLGDKNSIHRVDKLLQIYEGNVR